MQIGALSAMKLHHHTSFVLFVNWTLHVNAMTLETLPNTQDIENVPYHHAYEIVTITVRDCFLFRIILQYRLVKQSETINAEMMIIPTWYVVSSHGQSTNGRPFHGSYKPTKHSRLFTICSALIPITCMCSWGYNWYKGNWTNHYISNVTYQLRTGDALPSNVAQTNEGWTYDQRVGPAKSKTPRHHRPLIANQPYSQPGQRGQKWSHNDNRRP